MRIARTLHWKGELLIQSRLYHDQSPGSIPMDGNATAEASITPQWLPDSPKTGAPCGNRRTSAGGHFLRNHSLFEFVNAERLSDLIVSLLPRVLRQCALASLGQNRSTYQFAMDRSLSFPLGAQRLSASQTISPGNCARLSRPWIGAQRLSASQTISQALCVT